VALGPEGGGWMVGWLACGVTGRGLLALWVAALQAGVVAAGVLAVQWVIGDPVSL
jgi:hypothetical protein